MIASKSATEPSRFLSEVRKQRDSGQPAWRNLLPPNSHLYLKLPKRSHQARIYFVLGSKLQSLMMALREAFNKILGGQNVV